MSIKEHFRIMRWPSAVALSAVALVSLAACNDTTGSIADGGEILVINAAPSYASVGLKVDSIAVLQSAAAFGNGSISQTIPGSDSARLLTTYNATDGSTISAQNFVIHGDTAYIAVLTQPSSGAHLFIYPDTASSANADTASIRVTNVSPTATAVDVYITSYATTSLTGLSPVATNIGFEKSSAFLRYPSTYDSLRVWITDAGIPQNIRLDQPVDASPYQIDDFFVTDKLGGGYPLNWIVYPKNLLYSVY